MSVPRLYQMAMEDLGLQEGKGTADNPLVQRMYTATDYAAEGNLTGTHDSVPWCGAAMAWWCKGAGIPYQRKGAAAAINWLTDPNFKEIKKPIIGAIGVRHREGGNHVFIFGGWVDEKAGIFKQLGANQSGGKATGHDGAVTLVQANVAGVLGWRWPKKIPLPVAEQKYRKSPVIQGATISGAAGGVMVAAEAPQLAKALQDADSASSTGTIIGGIAAVIIIAAAVWIIVARINAARAERKTSA